MDTHTPRQQLAARGSIETSLTSSNLARCRYDGIRTLDIQFRTGSSYRYSPVPPMVVSEFLAAESHGRFFHESIKDAYECDVIDWESGSFPVEIVRVPEGEHRAFAPALPSAPPPVSRAAKGATRITLENVDAINTYIAPTPDQIERMKRLRSAARDFMVVILTECPECPTRTRALNGVDDARMLAMQAIARETL